MVSHHRINPLPVSTAETAVRHPTRTKTRIGIAVAAVLAVGVSTAGTGCSQETQQAPRMIRSSEEFQQGLAAGRRDATHSWTEESGAWSWLWMKDEDFRSGYDDGWRRGRAELRFKRQQQRAARDKDKNPGGER